MKNMKNMKKMLAALIAVMVFVLAAPAVFAEEATSEPQAEEQVVREEKSEEKKTEEKAEEPKAEAPKAEEKAEEPKTEEKIEEPKTEEIAAPEATEVVAEATSEVAAEPEAVPEVTAEPETTQEPEAIEAAIERSIKVVASESSLKVGETLKLTAKLSGFDGVQYKLNWQVKAQGGEWKDIGEHGETLKVELTAENIGSAWRVTVETAD